MLTLGNWLALIFIFVIIGGFIGFLLWVNTEEIFKTLFGLSVVFIFCVLLGLFLGWYNTHTASGIRAYKDFQSEMSNGIEREITITAEDGREIFHYEGKVDIESNHEDNYIKFESEEGKRYIIYYGIQATIQIIEK